MKIDQVVTVKVPRKKSFAQALGIINYELQKSDPMANFSLKECRPDEKHLTFKYICTGRAV